VLMEDLDFTQRRTAERCKGAAIPVLTLPCQMGPRIRFPPAICRILSGRCSRLCRRSWLTSVRARRESASRGNSPFHVEKPGFSAGVRKIR
jgi:hypothetical protein